MANLPGSSSGCGVSGVSIAPWHRRQVRRLGDRDLYRGVYSPSQPSCVYTAEMKTPQALGPQARTKPSRGRGDPCTPSTAHALDTITRGQPNCYTPRGPAPSPPLREPSVTPISRKRRARAEAAAT